MHPAQVIESRASGADAVLLIAAVLTDTELRALLEAAADLGLGTLVETHSDEDLGRALETHAPVIGVNARDLETLAVDVEGALTRLERLPAIDWACSRAASRPAGTWTPRSPPGRLPSWWGKP